MRVLLFFCCILLTAQLSWAGNDIEEISTKTTQVQNQNDRFLEVDFPSLYKEYKENKKKMTNFAFKTWWKQVNETLEGNYVRGTAIVKNVKDGWTGLHVKMGSDSKDDFISIILYINKQDQTEIQTALTLEPGKRLTFTGKLEKIDALWGTISVIFLEGAIGHEFKITEVSSSENEHSNIAQLESKNVEDKVDTELVLGGISTAIKILKFVVLRKR